jgi:hypothetical protein
MNASSTVPVTKRTTPSSLSCFCLVTGGAKFRARGPAHTVSAESLVQVVSGRLPGQIANIELCAHISLCLSIALVPTQEGTRQLVTLICKLPEPRTPHETVAPSTTRTNPYKAMHWLK